MKLNYFVIPLVTIITAITGSRITSQSAAWYKTIKIPGWTPPGSTIGLVWTIIFIISTVAALIVFNRATINQKFYLIFVMFVINALLNVSWSYLFFGQHLILAAFFEALILDLSVIILIIAIWPISLTASLLLMPYAAWVTFASYLTYSIWLLNK